MLRAGCRVPGAGCHASSRFGRSMLCVLLSAQCVVYATAKHALPGRVEAWHPGTRISLGWQALAYHVLHRVAEAIQLRPCGVHAR